MSFVQNWRAIILHAWSMRLLYATILLSGAEIALPYLDFLPIPRGLFAALSGITSAAACYARLVYQPPLHGEKKL